MHRRNRVLIPILLMLVASCCVDAEAARPQILTDAVVEKAAQPLLDKKIVDGLSIGYIEGEHYGIVHLGSAGRSGKKADNLTLYEIGSVTKVFTALLLADSVARGEIKLDAVAEAKNAAGLRLPSRDGRSITWLELSNHRAGLPRLPGNLQPKDPTNPYRDYDAKDAAAFLKTSVLPRSPGELQEYSNFGTSIL
jgi:CubicO group peptidase (beta-lactamase class C family)